MNYQELTGQESGVWIYKGTYGTGDWCALICNWSSAYAEDARPARFAEGLIWLPLEDKDEPWEKIGENIPLDCWLENCHFEWDPEDINSTTRWDLVDGDVYESEDYVIIAPKGWN